VRSVLLVVVTLAGLCMSGCTVVGFTTGVIIVNLREEEAARKPTQAERDACREHGDLHAETPDCSNRGIRAARRAKQPSAAGTIARYTLAGVAIDAVLVGLALVAIASAPSH